MADIIDINAVRAMRLALVDVPARTEERHFKWHVCETCEGKGLLRIQHDPVDLHAARLVPVAYGEHRDCDMVCHACAGFGHRVREVVA